MSWLVGHNVETDTHLTPEQKRDKVFIIKAEEASAKEEEREFG
jgi:hypothetical protein